MSQQLDLLATELVEKMTSSSQTLSIAESCTGGLLANTLTNVPGASSVFFEGVVSYSNAAKTRLLGVPLSLIEKHGAVSAEVAQAMAEAIQKKSGATFGLATTGIAGPSGGSKEKPVGTVFLAIAKAREETEVWQEFFPEKRLFFKEKATEQLLRQLLKRFSC